MIARLLPTGVVTVIGLWVAYISYTQTPSEAFLFPRIVSTVFVVLAAWALLRALSDNAPEGLSLALLARLGPGVAVMCVYGFWLAKALGFYTATLVAGFVLLSLYDPAPHTNPKSWAKRAIIATVFTAVLYGLFALLLKVYTPRDVLF